MKKIIGIMIILLILINVVLWTIVFKGFKNQVKDEVNINDEEQELVIEEDTDIPEVKSEQTSNISVINKHGIFIIKMINFDGKEAEVAFNDKLETVVSQFGEPDKKEQDMDTLNYVYRNLSIGIDEATNLVSFIHFSADPTIFNTEWYKKLGEPDMGTSDDSHYFYNADGTLILKFDVYENEVNVHLFKNYDQYEEIPDEEEKEAVPQQKPYKTLSDPIYGGDVIKIATIGPVRASGQTSWVVAHIEPLIGESGFASYGENGQLPQQVFKPLDKIVKAYDLSFWLEPAERGTLRIMSGESAHFHLFVKVAPRPRYANYNFSVDFKFFPEGTGHVLPIRKLNNIEIKIAK